MKSKIVKNAAWIIGGKIVQSALGLIISMLTARYLGPKNFGLINYAASIVAFVTPIMTLGFDAILVQEIVKNPKKEGEILGTTFVLNLSSGLVTILGVITFVVVANPHEKVTLVVCSLYSLSLLCRAIDMIEFWFQAKLLSKYTSIVSLVAYGSVSLYKAALLITKKSIIWFALSNVLDYLIIAIGLVIIYFKLGGTKLSFSLKTGKKLFEKSKYYIISNMMVTIFAQTDRVMLKLMIDDAATGYYSAAVTCAGMTSFVFAAIIDSARPAIFTSKQRNQKLFENNMANLYSIIIYFALIQSVIISIFSKTIVNILYGSAYNDSVSVLKIIVWYTTFSYLGAVRNIWILAEERQKVLWVINLSGAIINVVLNLILIPFWNIIGAALASLLTQIFTNVIIGFIIPSIRKNNKLMMKGMNPSLVYCFIKNVKNS